MVPVLCPFRHLRDLIRKDRCLLRVPAVVGLDRGVYSAASQLPAMPVHRYVNRLDLLLNAFQQLHRQSSYHKSHHVSARSSLEFAVIHVTFIRFVAVTISSVMLLVWDIGKAGHFFAYIIGKLSSSLRAHNTHVPSWSRVCGSSDECKRDSTAHLRYLADSRKFAWANTLCGDDDVLRAVTLYSMQVFSQLCEPKFSRKSPSLPM